MFSDSHHGFSFVLSSFSNISRLQSEDFVSYPLVAWSLEIFSSLARDYSPSSLTQPGSAGYAIVQEYSFGEELLLHYVT
jgi:hypothetical protein